MKRLLCLLSISIFMFGCKESSYNPGDLGVAPLDVVVPEPPTSLEKVGINLSDIIKALHFAYLDDVLVDIDSAAQAQIIIEDEDSEDEDDISLKEGFSDLSPEVQAFVLALYNTDCSAYREYMDVYIKGDGCPFYFNYYNGEGFGIEFEVFEEDLAELIDIYFLGMEGSRLTDLLRRGPVPLGASDLPPGDDDDDSEDEEENVLADVQLHFELESYEHGTLSGFLARYQELYEDEYIDAFLTYVNFEDFEADDIEDRIEELSRNLLGVFDEIETILEDTLIGEEI